MIYLIDKIKQKNNGSFYLVDAADVEYNGDSLETALENMSGSSSSGEISEADIATEAEVSEMLDEIFGTTETESDDG